MRDGTRDSPARVHSVEPQLAELLRTCIRPPTLFLRIASILRFDIFTKASNANTQNVDLPPPDTDRLYATKLLVSDGELMIQALLHRKLSVLTEAANIQPGDLLDIRKFVIKKAKRTNGQGTVIYLGIEDCYFITQCPSRLAPSASMDGAAAQEEKRRLPQGQKRPAQQTDSGTNHLEPDMEIAQPPNKRPRLSRACTQGRSSEVRMVSSAGHKHPRDTASLSHLSDQDDFDDFEVLEADEQQVRSRRKALQELDSNIVSSSSSTSNDKTTSPIRPFRPPPQVPLHAYQLSQCNYSSDGRPHEVPTVQQMTTQPPPLALTKPLPAPPLHTLASLRVDNTLPTRNYAVTVLAYVSWTGTTLIHRPGSPFPPKRHVKLVDASLVKSRPVSRSDNKGVPITATLQQSNNPGSRPVSRSGPAMSSSSTPRSSTVFTPQNSFQDAITLAVFADATIFKPTAGTLALFRGIVMQRLGNGDVILNAYARIKEQRFLARESDTGQCAEEGWFVDDIDVIRALGYGSELEALRRWWEERRAPV